MNEAFQTFGHGTSRSSSGTTNFIVDNRVKSPVERQERGNNFICFFFQLPRHVRKDTRRGASIKHLPRVYF